MMRRQPPPFDLQRMLQDRNGLLTRLELAFALERVRPLRSNPHARRVVESGSKNEAE